MTVIQDISVPAGSIKSPKGFFRAGFAKFFLGSRFALGLVIFLLGVMVVVMLAKRAGVPTGAVEGLVR